MSEFWSWYVIILVVLNIVGCFLLLYFTRNIETDDAGDGTTGHEYDGIREYNKPLPRWWLWLFYITIVFSIVYLVIYPGLGNYKGTAGWSSSGQHMAEVQAAEEHYGPIFAQYAAQPITDLVNNDEAVAMGQRIFANNCIACHGSDGRGAKGYPNLADNDWLYGNQPEQVKTSIVNGRSGMMPPMAAALGGDEGVADVVAYVQSLSGQNVDAEAAGRGKTKFMVCAACHGMEGKGNVMLGAPNLTDDIWLYGGDAASITEAIVKGRNGIMPAQAEILTPEQIHIVTAYVLSLSQ